MRNVASCLFVVLGLVSTGAAAKELKFDLKNGTSSTLKGFYISDTGTSSWEENLFAGDSLKPGESAGITVDAGNICKYDIKATFADGGKVEDMNINLCEIGSYEVHE